MSYRFKKIIKSQGIVLVDFYADWCIPCQELQPVLKEVKTAYKDHIRMIKVNVDKNPFIASEYKVKNIPTLILFKSGNPKWTGVGIYNASYLKEIIQKVV